MKTTMRKMTARQTTARQTTQPLGPSPDPRRPLLPDAPDWFNRARVLANQKQTIWLRPVPLAQNCFVPRGGAAGPWRIRNKTIVLGLSLVALPAVFLMGFLTRGVVAPVQRDSVISGKADSSVQMLAARDRKNDVTQHFADAPAALLVPNAAPAHIDGSVTNVERQKSVEQPPEVARRRRPPRPSTIAATLDTSTPPLDRVAHVPATEAASGLSGQLSTPDPIDGFALRSPVAGQFVADVQIPGNSWFSLAGADPDCESGTCKVVPVKTVDRKLNTALEWSSTPQQAAEQAAREGKLVFLIHVSGNFSQPGFT